MSKNNKCTITGALVAQGHMDNLQRLADTVYKLLQLCGKPCEGLADDRLDEMDPIISELDKIYTELQESTIPL